MILGVRHMPTACEKTDVIRAGRTMTAPIIEIDRVSKSFGHHQVLRDLSFTVAPGEKLALIGPSGSGKTTILRILMTLETITGGHILVEGEHLWHMPRNGGLAPADERHLHKMRAKIGMVFQLFNLFPHKTVLENVTLAPMLTKGVPKPEAELRAGLGTVADLYRSEPEPALLAI